MARERMVTRTITTTVAEVTKMDVTTKEVETYEFEVAGKIEDEKDLIKAVLSNLSNTLTGRDRVVMCVPVRYIDTLYGMTEADFIKYAEILPARATKEE